MRFTATDPYVRFERAYVPVPFSGCWLWLGYILSDRHYGLFYLNGRYEHAHRAAFLLFKGAIPEGVCVLHSCDINACVNPDHLRLGTFKDNSDDCIKRGRRNAPRGENHCHAILTEEKVRYIRSSKLTGTALARELGISIIQACKIKRGSAWKHIL